MPNDESPQNDAKLDPLPDGLKNKNIMQSFASIQRELRDLASPAQDAPPKPPVDLKKAFLRVAGIVALIWLAALVVLRWTVIPLFVAGGLTLVAIGLGVWLVRYVNKSRTLGALLHSASQTDEGRKRGAQETRVGLQKG